MRRIVTCNVLSLVSLFSFSSPFIFFFNLTRQPERFPTALDLFHLYNTCIGRTGATEVIEQTFRLSQSQPIHVNIINQRNITFIQGDPAEKWTLVPRLVRCEIYYGHAL